eukprot:scaffold340906_cov24-Prasinocladus_malaysianus.AAC.1
MARIDYAATRDSACGQRPAYAHPRYLLKTAYHPNTRTVVVIAFTAGTGSQCGVLPLQPGESRGDDPIESPWPKGSQNSPCR